MARTSSVGKRLSSDMAKLRGVQREGVKSGGGSGGGSGGVVGWWGGGAEMVM